MPFIELNRSFVPLEKDQESTLDPDLRWLLDSRLGRWLSWPELLEKRRVVLLAEALSGKTEEFSQQAKTLSKQGHFAFFIPIEMLADGDISNALNPSEMEALESWLKGEAEGWFFLDSVDETRLRQKSVEAALRRVAHKLGDALRRAHVLVSCRVTDWKGKADRDAVESILTVAEPDYREDYDDSAALLLDPIFGYDETTVDWDNNKTEPPPLELLIVQLVPLTSEQRRLMAVGCDVQDTDAFLQAIERQGLDALVERPGDLLALIEYWKNHGRFSSLAEMTEHGIIRKLEDDNFRPDNDILSLEKSRRGAERLAAALTFCQSLTLRTPAQEADPELSVEALDPAHILGDDWVPAERNALLRRGIFVPSTYGRVRFHHRSTQEYLTAQWLHRVQQEGWAKPEIWNLLFAERYGVKTVVPSLRPAAAWLALKDTSLAEEIIRREPLVLLQHGDPGSLPLQLRRRLLRLYAEKHAKGEIANDLLDHRALWMFAHEELADTVREVWNHNERPEFRNTLLHLIAEGAIIDCADLARDVAHDETAENHERSFALQALYRCQDREGIVHVIQNLMADPSRASARLASGFAEILFPDFLSVEEVLTLIAESQPSEKYTASGFPSILNELYERCPDATSRRQFISGIADLCLSPPFADDYERISERYENLAERLHPIARHAIQELGNREPPSHLVRLLMVIERAGSNAVSNDDAPLAESVQKKPKLNRALFWADVEETREHGDHPSGVPKWWQTRFTGTSLWEIDSTALSWLYEDVSDRVLVDDQRVALSAIVMRLRHEERLDAEVTQLRESIAGRQLLEEDLERYLTPPPDQDEELRWQQESRRRKLRKAEDDKKAKVSWVKFQKELMEEPSRIGNPSFVAMPEGVNILYNLTRWLAFRTSEHKYEQAALNWPLLRTGFSQAVAEAYEEGMKAFWRVSKPERPKRQDGGGITYKWSMILSYAGVAIEARETPDWATYLTEEEALLAAKHSCMAERDYPEWIDTLVVAYPDRVLPILRRELKEEWRSNKGGPLFFFSHYAHSSETISTDIQRELLEVILGKEPQNLDRLGRGIKILQKLDLNDKDRRRIIRISRKRMHQHAEEGRDQFVLFYLACLLLLDFARALGDFAGWLDAADSQEQQWKSELAFGTLFGHDGFIMSLQHIPAQGLEELLRLTYQHIRPEDDLPFQAGLSTPYGRKDAEDARSTIFNTLLDRSGEEAYRALLRLSEDEHLRQRVVRYRELAHGMAERDAELIPWSTDEVLKFEREHAAAIKSGEDLLRAASSVLGEIRHDFAQADASSRYVLQTAGGESAVQHWLAEQLRLRAHEMFHVMREIEVADLKKPDITFSSIATPLCEVAIEVKRADSCSAQELEDALCNQLAEDYLKPASRRQGILVVTYQGNKRYWKHPETQARLLFSDLISYLEEKASTLTETSKRDIAVRVVGIDASSS